MCEYDGIGEHKPTHSPVVGDVCLVYKSFFTAECDKEETEAVRVVLVYPNSAWNLLVVRDGAEDSFYQLRSQDIVMILYNINDSEKQETPEHNKYMREIKPGVWVDVYDVLQAFVVTNPALQHLIKKALAVGQRGHKDASEDYQDIIDSSVRAKQLHEEWDEK